MMRLLNWFKPTPPPVNPCAMAMEEAGEFLDAASKEHDSDCLCWVEVRNRTGYLSVRNPGGRIVDYRTFPLHWDYGSTVLGLGTMP